MNQSNSFVECIQLGHDKRHYHPVSQTTCMLVTVNYYDGYDVTCDLTSDVCRGMTLETSRRKHVIYCTILCAPSFMQANNIWCASSLQHRLMIWTIFLPLSITVSLPLIVTIILTSNIQLCIEEMPEQSTNTFSVNSQLNVSFCLLLAWMQLLAYGSNTLEGIYLLQWSYSGSIHCFIV